MSTRKKERGEIPSRSISKCKGPVARGCLASKKHLEKVYVAGLGRVKGIGDALRVSRLD